MNYVRGSKEWFERQFSDIEDERLGDRWGHRWRGSQKFRYDIYVDLLKRILPVKQKIKILDIGCALGDFTKRVQNLDPKNEIFGIDISEKAIKQISKEFTKNKYLDVKFSTSSLPLIPFKDQSFNLVLCLEVLYYLDTEDRIESVKDINRVLKLNGYLLLSGGLDGGIRYFAEDKIIALLSKYFDIEATEYNYARIYTIIEKKILFLLYTLEIAKSLLEKSDDEFLKWCEETEDKQKVKTAKKLRKIFYSIPLGENVWRVMCIFTGDIMRKLISRKFPVVLSYKFTRFMLGNKGKTNIIILARKSKKEAQ